MIEKTMRNIYDAYKIKSKVSKDSIATSTFKSMHANSELNLLKDLASANEWDDRTAHLLRVQNSIATRLRKLNVATCPRKFD